MSYTEEWQTWINSCVMMCQTGRCPVDDEYLCSPDNMDCPFHQTAEQQSQSQMIWKQRMNQLPSEEQNHIAETYFKGKMPWRDAK